MSNAKHTPGPWLSATKPEQDHRVFFIYHDDGSNWLPALEIATIYSGGNENAPSDARLIAAAPELLEMLEQCASVLFAESQLSNSSDIKHMAIEIKALIAKTTGGAK